MAENRIPFGSMIQVLRTFIDYRQGSGNKSNTSYKIGDIVPVDSFLVFTATNLARSGFIKKLEGQIWEGYESDFSITPESFTEYPLLKVRFKNEGNYFILPNLDSLSAFQIRESFLINDGDNSFGIKYSNGEIFSNMVIPSKEAFKIIYIDDESDKGRWMFTPFLYREDANLETSSGSGSDNIDLTSIASAPTVPGDYVAFENLEINDFVSFINDEGTLKIKKALASSSSTKAIGFVKKAYLTDTLVEIHTSGSMIKSGLTSDKKYFLSETVPGQVQLELPTNLGSIIQQIGASTSTTQLNVNINDCYVVTN